MEKTFEEKFGLRTDEMNAILGGVVTNPDNVQGGCSFCNTCVYCSTCLGCSSGNCMMCQTVAFTNSVPNTNTNTLSSQATEIPSSASSEAVLLA